MTTYAYCVRDHVSLTALSGHISWQVIAGVVTTIIGIGLALLTGWYAVMAAECIGAVINTASPGLRTGLMADATESNG